MPGSGSPVAGVQDDVVPGAVDVQDGHGGRSVAGGVLDVAGTGQAGDGAKAGQSLAGDVVGHESAVGVSEEVHGAEVGDFSRLGYELGEVGDVVLWGVA